MSALMTLTGAFRESRALVVKAAKKPKRFNREKASEPLQEDVARLWREGIAAHARTTSAATAALRTARRAADMAPGPRP